jgi:hypothetical protein
MLIEFPYPSLHFLTDYPTSTNVGVLTEQDLESKDHLLNGSKPYLFLNPYSPFVRSD